VTTSVPPQRLNHLFQVFIFCHLALESSCGLGNCYICLSEKCTQFLWLSAGAFHEGDAVPLPLMKNRKAAGPFNDGSAALMVIVSMRPG
jgi:hypothetical protein